MEGEGIIRRDLRGRGGGGKEDIAYQEHPLVFLRYVVQIGEVVHPGNIVALCGIGRPSHASHEDLHGPRTSLFSVQEGRRCFARHIVRTGVTILPTESKAPTELVGATACNRVLAFANGVGDHGAIVRASQTCFHA